MIMVSSGLKLREAKQKLYRIMVDRLNKLHDYFKNQIKQTREECEQQLKLIIESKKLELKVNITMNIMCKLFIRDIRQKTQSLFRRLLICLIKNIAQEKTI